MTDRDSRPAEHSSAKRTELTDPLVVAAFDDWNDGCVPTTQSFRFVGYGG